MSILISLSHVHNNFTTESKVAVPKIITILFFIFTFIFGKDFGFIKILDKKLRNVAKLISSTISLIIILILLVPLDDTRRADYYWYILAFLEFMCSIIIFKLSKYTLYDFLLEMHSIDKNITKINKLKIGVLLWVYLFFWYFVKLYIDYSDCEIYFPGSCNIHYIPQLVYNMISDSVDFVFVIPTFIYCYLYYCIKDVHELLQNDLNISLLKMRYIAIMNCCDKIRHLYEKLIILELLEIPKMMGLIYNMLKYWMEGAGLLPSLGEYLYALNIISNMLCSAAMGQMVVYQVDAIKMQLHAMLLDEKGRETSKEICRLLGYMNTRQFLRPVAGVIPVDMRLATTAFSVFATYMIVLVQLTHLVD